MPKQTWINVNGVWKPVKSVWANINGIWQKNIVPYGKINGEWKEFMKYGPTYPIVLDDFENEESLNSYIGYGATGQLNSDTVYSGNYSLEVTTDEGGSPFISVNGLSQYPQQGTKFSVRAFHNNGNCMLLFGVQDENNYYEASTSFGASSTGDMYIKSHIDGTVTELVQYSITTDEIPQAQWLIFEIYWHKNGTIRFVVTSSITSIEISTVDNTFTNGGIGFSTNSYKGGGSVAYYDLLQIDDEIE